MSAVESPDKAHVLWGGSNIHRRIACTLSAEREASLPSYETSNSAAERGTVLHDCLEYCLNEEVTPFTFRGMTDEKYGYAVTEDDEFQMELALEAINKLFDDYGIESWITEQFMLMDPEVGGSADVIAWGPEWVLVIDWKMGVQFVSAYQNKQAMFYALCAQEQKTPELKQIFENRKVALAIIQPACNDQAQVYEPDPDELDHFYNVVWESIETSRSGKGTAVVGDHCHYCKFRPHCPEARNSVDKFLKLDPALGEDVAQGMDLVPVVKEHIKAIETAAFNYLQHGHEVRGWKLVKKKARRYWKDTAAVLHKFRYNKSIKKDMYIKEELRSPAQVETALKKAKIDKVDFSDLVSTESKDLTLAPADDKREAERGKHVVPESLDTLFKKHGL